MKIVSAFLLCIALTVPAQAAMEDMPPSNHHAPNESLVPTHVSGIVTRLPEMSLCMDGATHRIHTRKGDIRLKGRTPESAQQLARAADSRQKASIMGYFVTGPECSYLSVYSVSLMLSADPPQPAESK